MFDVVLILVLVLGFIDTVDLLPIFIVLIEYKIRPISKATGGIQLQNSSDFVGFSPFDLFISVINIIINSATAINASAVIIVKIPASLVGFITASPWCQRVSPANSKAIKNPLNIALMSNITITPYMSIIPNYLYDPIII